MAIKCTLEFRIKNMFLLHPSHLHRIFTNKCNKHSTTYTQIHLMNVRTITRQLLTCYLLNCFILKKCNNVKENSLDKITYLLPTHLFCTLKDNNVKDEK